MKKTLPLLAALLAAAFLLCSCASQPPAGNAEGSSAPNDAATPAPEQQSGPQPVELKDGFDTRLFGTWVVVSEEAAGADAFLYGGGENSVLYFLHKGAYGGTVFGFNVPNSPLGFITCDGHTMNFPEYEAAANSELTIEYELGDIEGTPRAVEYGYEKEALVQDVFDADTADRLTLHITGYRQATPTQRDEIDTVIVLEKDWPIMGNYFGYIEWNLVGEWVDNSGNVWSFNERSPENVGGHPDLIFSLTTPNGTVYEGDFFTFLFHEIDGKLYEEANFHFSDSAADVSEYSITAFDDSFLEMKKGDRTITLTRVED